MLHFKICHQFGLILQHFQEHLAIPPRPKQWRTLLCSTLQKLYFHFARHANLVVVYSIECSFCYQHDSIKCSKLGALVKDVVEYTWALRISRKVIQQPFQAVTWTTHYYVGWLCGEKGNRDERQEYNLQLQIPIERVNTQVMLSPTLNFLECLHAITTTLELTKIVWQLQKGSGYDPGYKLCLTDWVI
jgi:hypothetical protein